MPGVPPDAMDQMKKAFKGLFRSKKSKKEDATPSTTSNVESSAPTKPTESTPSAPAPVTTPTPTKPKTEPATEGSTLPPPAEPAQLAQSAAAPVQTEANKDETAALTEVKKATQTPEPAGATVPAPPTAASAQPLHSEAPANTDAKGISSPSAPIDLPAISASKSASGMSATSGPMGVEPDFGSEGKEEEPVVSDPNPAASGSTVTGSATQSPAEK